jgi:hypothetical protein
MRPQATALAAARPAFFPERSRFKTASSRGQQQMVLACCSAATGAASDMFQFGTFSRKRCSGPATLDLNLF